MAQGRLTDEQVARLNELNKQCEICMENARKHFLTKDLKACMTCPIGHEVHQLDRDDIDGHNSARYEPYFTA
ncbi:MAG: hypothetical protein HFJ58_04595 [Clostridia bacterium]|nr:hypothetical protein [Clostridia bacterium]